MIQPITKLVTISPVPKGEQKSYLLDTADGRFTLADRIQNDIDEWCQKVFDDGPRTHLGASVIGQECDRHIWYTWRWFKHKIFSGRMQRLFQDGHWYEDRIIEMLRGIGFTVTQVSEDGNQQRIFAVQGHFGGSTDGTAILPERYGELIAKYGAFLLEFKTANEKNFLKFHDVAHSKPEHFGQMCVYAVKLGIRHGIYFQVCKNDADMHIEVVEMDWEHGKRLIEKGEHIIYSLYAPAKLSESPSDYRCKMCDHHSVCHMKAKPDVNCRSCKYSLPVDNKQWRCNKWSAIIPSKEAMLAACDAYELLQGE